VIDDYLDQLESELMRASRRRLRLAAARAPRVPAGAAATVAAIAVCAVVALAVLQVGGARRGARRVAASAPAPAAVPVGAGALVRELGVFRRPQTAADRIVGPIPRLFAFAALPGEHGFPQLRIVPSLTRLVVKLPTGHRVFLAIGRLGSGRSYVVVWLETPFVRYVNPSSSQGVPLGSSGTLGASPALVARQLRHSADNSVPEGIPEDPQGNSGPKLWISIAPDSVVSARWTVKYGHGPDKLITLPVSSNVALLTVPEMQRDLVWKMSWLARNGRVIATWGPYRTAFQ
jgi:hypothetical protein